MKIFNYLNYYCKFMGSIVIIISTLLTLYLLQNIAKREEVPLKAVESKRLNLILSEIDVLKKRNLELIKTLNNFRNNDTIGNNRTSFQGLENHTRLTMDSKNNMKNGPSLKFQILQRRILNNIKDLWYFIYHQQKQLRTIKSIHSTLDHLHSVGIEHIRALLSDTMELTNNDGYNEWRNEETSILSNTVQKRFHSLQNPKNCKEAKKLLCHINYKCGYGCQIHHLLSCFMVAYGLKRTVILKSKGWSYNPAGWEEIFKPISETCTESDGSHDVWPGTNASHIISIPIEISIEPRPKFIPQAIPEDLAPRLLRLHGNPIVWWVGQALRYILRYDDNTFNYIQNMISHLNIKDPIVGVHVRRTDKIGTEAAFHSIEEYMVEVDAYYDQLKLTQNTSKRRIYLATDEVAVIVEAKLKYPHYDIISNPNKTKSHPQNSLHTSDNLLDVILDVYILSTTNFLVCTFSSNVCRLAYELMQTYYPDASERFRSLDDVYYYSQQLYNKRRVVLPHNRTDNTEIDLKVGDIIHLAGNHWDGYSLGKNLRTMQFGLFPSFKIENEPEIVKFPTTL